MKVVYFFRSLAIWGGIERIIVDKSNWLADYGGCEVTILTSDQGSHPVPYSVSQAVKVEDLGVRLHQRYRYRGLRRLWVGWRLRRQLVDRLRQRLQQLQPDVVVTVVTDYSGVVVKAAGGRWPVVAESHSVCIRSFGHSVFHDWQLMKSLKQCSALVALTEGDARQWQRRLAAVHYIPNMVALNTTGRRGDAAHKKVIFVGRLDYQKQAEVAVSIWQRVWPSHQDWQLHIYGDGERRQAIAQAVAHTGGVTLHEPTASIWDAYCDSTFLILTSLFEPFGLVMAEAMSCGLPVVAMDCDYGPRTIVTNGVDGYLVADGDEAAFASRMSMLMDDDELCRRMGRAAEVSAQRFTASVVMPQWQHLFVSVCSSG